MILRFASLLIMSFILSFASVSALQDDKRASMLRSEKTMYDYAQCLLTSKRREKAINEFLLIPDGHADQSNLDEKLIVPDCANPGEKLVFKGNLFRRSLYVALYNKYYRKSAPNAFQNSVLDYNQEVSPKYGQIKGDQLALRIFSDCTIKSNVAAAHGFVIANPQSSEETGYINIISAALNDCIPEGGQLSISRSNLKSAMAEALYKMRSIPSSEGGNA